MNQRLLFALLLALLSQQALGQSEDSTQGPGFDDEESRVDIPEEGSGAQGFGDTINAPLIEDAETTTPNSRDDDIQCADNLCTCSHETDGDAVKITVDCSSKGLTEFPAGIDKRVTTLFLQNNDLQEIPKEISNFQNLQELNVNNNSIKGFAFGSISELPNLQILKASNNRLLEFPQELKNGFDLRSLQELDLGNNDMREKLTADLFTHMESIKSITLPETTHELIENLCHTLHETLQKVCTNNCNVDIEECVNYADNSSDLIPEISSNIQENQEQDSDFDQEAEIETNIKNQTEENEIEPGLDEESNMEKTTESGLDEENKSDYAVSESNLESVLKPEHVDKQDSYSTTDSNKDTDKETTTLSNKNEDENTSTPKTKISAEENESELKNDEALKVDVSIRNALTVASDVSNNVPSESSNVSVSGVESDAKESGSENDKIVDSEQDKETSDDVNGGVVGASSTKQGGGISNSIIAIIVAGMIVVVAGVTIGKNWKSIRNKLSSRPSPATGAPATNGVTPEEVPLQNKSMV